MKICSVVLELLSADREMDGQADRYGEVETRIFATFRCKRAKI
jgi:hypothetical protein